MENRFPASYPSDLYERIIRDGGANNKFDRVYRVASYGVINRDVFLSTKEESKFSNISRGNVNRDACMDTLRTDYDIGDYSVSFFEEKRDANKIRKLKKKHHDGPVLIAGSILPEHGLSIRTSESTDPNRKTKNSHVDLWKYESADLTGLFEIVEEE